MPDQAVTTIVGLFGKMPAHGDFVRRGLPAQVVQRLDDWLQVEFGRAPDPSVAIAALPPLRLASLDIEPGTLALGTMIASHDKVGRHFPLMAVRLSAYLEAKLPEPVPAAWDDWCSDAEQQLLAARDDSVTADFALASLDQGELAAVHRAAEDELPLGTSAWRSASSLEGLPVRTDGLPRGVDFDRLVTP